MGTAEQPCWTIRKRLIKRPLKLRNPRCSRRIPSASVWRSTSPSSTTRSSTRPRRLANSPRLPLMRPLPSWTSSNFFLLLQKPPTPLSTMPYLFTFCQQKNIIKKNNQSLEKIIIQDQVLLSPPHYQQLL